MGLLYEPEKADDSFVLTPDYDDLLLAYASTSPDHPDPRFNKDDCHPFTFRWPPDLSPLEAKRAALRRAADGRFVKSGDV